MMTTQYINFLCSYLVPLECTQITQKEGYYKLHSRTCSNKYQFFSSVAELKSLYGLEQLGFKIIYFSQILNMFYHNQVSTALCADYIWLMGYEPWD